MSDGFQSDANAVIVRTNRGPPPDEILLGDMDSSIDSPLSSKLIK